MGCTNLLFDNTDTFFVPVLSTAIEWLEMFILHTIETVRNLISKINLKRFISHNLARALFCHSTNKYSKFPFKISQNFLALNIATSFRPREMSSDFLKFFSVRIYE